MSDSVCRRLIVQSFVAIRILLPNEVMPTTPAKPTEHLETLTHGATVGRAPAAEVELRPGVGLGGPLPGATPTPQPQRVVVVPAEVADPIVPLEAVGAVLVARLAPPAPLTP